MLDDVCKLSGKVFGPFGQAGGCSHVVQGADVDEGEADELVQALLQQVSAQGCADHFRGKGGRAFRAHYLHMWDRVRPSKS
jgi:hypothetical protein